MPITEGGEGATIREGVNDTVENAILKVGIHVGPRQPADDVIGFLGCFRDKTGQVFRGIIDHVQSGEPAPQLDCAVVIEFDHEELGLFAQAIHDHAGEGTGAWAQFDDEFCAAEIAIGEDGAGEGGGTGPEGTNGQRIANKRADELQSFIKG